ncbi:MAG TPA: hypothetical protein VH054_09975, partial [Polyangiaceae bacterium]|nr:hypothetical protein [Polyangiaceae bacterium]
IHGQPDQLTVSVTLARQGQGYGPITNTWTVAPGTLKGTVYYGSYGTRLSTSNWSGLIGASVLSLTHGAASPSLVTSQTQCQVCHSVAAKGANLVAESDPYAGDGNDWDVWYDLTKPTQPQSPGTWLPKTNPGAFTWGATTPDGSLYFTNAAPCWFSQSSSCVNALPSDELEGANDAPSALYTLSNGAGTSAVTATQIGQQLGLTTPLAGALPEFSPDGKHVVFTFFRGGPATDKTSGDGKSLAVVDFDQSTKTFSNLRTIYTPTCSGCTATAPFFLPTSDAVVFEVITRSNGFFGGTTSDRGEDASWGNCPNLVGAHAELWWVDLATKTPHRLDVANGAGYAPTGPNGHGDDTTLQFDPTVAPVVSGGYVWVAFMSRRLYGNVATINPWCSQTNGVDFTPFSENPMTKKLWVTAFDLNAPPGSDASHPAFYLPGQELTAGNFRSFWVLDPCKKDGTSCGTGDECCGGHCVTDTDGGGATCGTPIGCSGEGDTCPSLRIRRARPTFRRRSRARPTPRRSRCRRRSSRPRTTRSRNRAATNLRPRIASTSDSTRRARSRSGIRATFARSRRGRPRPCAPAITATRDAPSIRGFYTIRRPSRASHSRTSSSRAASTSRRARCSKRSSRRTPKATPRAGSTRSSARRSRRRTRRRDAGKSRATRSRSTSPG